MLTFEDIIRKPQHQLKKALMAELSKMGYKTRTRSGFLYAKGRVPVLLVAHLDTVHKDSVKTICYSEDGKIMMSPEGIGGDDRAGVYMILQIIKDHKCHVLFCEDEEIGCVGANKFADSEIKPNVNYIVEVDRRGDNDAVFYDCDNPDFTEFVTSFGFKEERGSFSDISIIAPALKIAAVNISAGYFNEHTKHEYINLETVHNNIERIKQMISTKTEAFEYIEAAYSLSLLGGNYYEDIYDFKSYFSCEDTEVIKLMELPDSSYVRDSDGDNQECWGQYLIDESGNVYEYLYDIDVMVFKNGYSAFGEQGLPAKFSHKNALNYEVVSEKYALELERELYGNVW